MERDPAFTVFGMTELRSTGKSPVPVAIAKFSQHGRVYALLNVGNNIFGTMRSHDYDIREQPKEHRAAWCRLTRMTNAHLNQAVKAFDEQRRKADNADEVRTLKKDAGKLGYRLVKNNLED